MALGLVLALAATPSAKADTLSYFNVSGAFSNGQQLSGQISFNSFGIVTGYSLNLTGASNTLSCSGFCAVAGGIFNSASGNALFSGAFSTFGSLGTITFGNWWSPTTLTTKLSLSATSVPEEPALLQVMLVLLTLGLVFLSRRDRLATLFA